ncbi:hypothetical protein D3C85_1230190 [compost metagenome]
MAVGFKANGTKALADEIGTLVSLANGLFDLVRIKRCRKVVVMGGEAKDRIAHTSSDKVDW